MEAVFNYDKVDCEAFPGLEFWLDPSKDDLKLNVDFKKQTYNLGWISRNYGALNLTKIGALLPGLTPDNTKGGTIALQRDLKPEDVAGPPREVTLKCGDWLYGVSRDGCNPMFFVQNPATGVRRYIGYISANTLRLYAGTRSGKDFGADWEADGRISLSDLASYTQHRALLVAFSEDRDLPSRQKSASGEESGDDWAQHCQLREYGEHTYVPMPLELNKYCPRMGKWYRIRGASDGGIPIWVYYWEDFNTGDVNPEGSTSFVTRRS